MPNGSCCSSALCWSCCSNTPPPLASSMWPCVHPAGAKDDFRDQWGADDKDRLSRYDGLRACRFNPLGAYVPGMTNHFQPSRPASTQALAVSRDPRISVVSGQPTPAERMMLEMSRAPPDSGLSPGCGTMPGCGAGVPSRGTGGILFVMVISGSSSSSRRTGEGQRGAPAAAFAVRRRSIDSGCRDPGHGVGSNPNGPVPPSGVAWSGARRLHQRRGGSLPWRCLPDGR